MAKHAPTRRTPSKRSSLAKPAVPLDATTEHHADIRIGDTDWADVISILRQSGYLGCIDIEGWHDPVYRHELEITGQK